MPLAGALITVLMALSAVQLPASAAATVVAGDFEAGTLVPWTETFEAQTPEICVWACGEIHTEIRARSAGDPGSDSYVLYGRYGGQSGGHTGVFLVRDLSSLSIPTDRILTFSFYTRNNVDACGNDCWRILEVYLWYARADGSPGVVGWLRYWRCDWQDCPGWYREDFGSEGTFVFDVSAVIPAEDRNADTRITKITLGHYYKSFGSSSTAPIEVFWDDIQLTAVSPNLPPHAVISRPGAGEAFAEGDLVVFDASSSSDSEGALASYEWDFGDGETAVGPTVEHAFADDGSYGVTLTVTDADGMTDVATSTVDIRNAAPETTIESVSQPNRFFILPGERVNFAGRSTDPGRDDLAVVWGFGDGANAVATYHAEGASPFTVTDIQSHVYASPGIYTVTLTVTDDDGATSTDTVAVEVLTGPQATQVISDHIQGLPRNAFFDNPDQRSNALANKLEAVLHMLGARDYLGAVEKLTNDIRAKADGEGQDWIIDAEARGDLTLMLDSLIAYLRTLA